MGDGQSPTPAAATSASPINERVAKLINDLIRVATGAGEHHHGDRLRDEATRWRVKETSVVVAAEPNRGKSSLVNALLGQEIVPSGAVTATSAYLVVRHGDERSVSVLRDGAAPTTASFEQIAELATAPPSEGIEGVVVELPHPLLATGLVLVDTPGVGSLAEAHGRITLTALSKADAMVFVLDPAEPLSSTELSFLTKAAERLERVVFAMARIDRHPGWQQILDDDRRLIEHHAPRFASSPMVPTSARLARTAVELGDPSGPDPELLRESGVETLSEQVLRSIVGKVAAIRLANMLRLATTTLDEMERPLRAAAEAALGDSAALGVVEREQAGFDELREAAERLQVDVTDRFNAIREVAGNEFTRIMRELGARFDANKAGSVASGEELIDRVYAELRAECAELSERLDDEVSQIAEHIAAVVGDLDVDLGTLELGSDMFAPTGSTDSADGADPMMRLRIASAVASGGTGFTMFARYVATDPLLAGMLGAGALLAVTVAAINVKMTRRQRDEAGIRKQVQAALEGARTEVSPVLRQQILSVQRELERAMKASIRQQSKGYQARIADATQLARSDTATRQAAKADAERRLAELSPLRQRIDALATELDRILSVS